MGRAERLARGADPAGFALHMARADLAANILPRSGAGHHRGLVLGNSAGLVDAYYVGQVITGKNRLCANGRQAGPTYLGLLADMITRAGRP